MGFPFSKVHRVSRRKLGRGQVPSRAAVTVSATALGSVATLTFSVPVVVSGPVDLGVPGVTFVSQNQSSSTVLAITYSGAITGKDWAIDPSAPVLSFEGGAVAPNGGTF